jgi:broad specificity phosphatase PhoE
VTQLALIRHLPTAWNEAGLLQGRADPGLADDAMAGWRAPRDFDGFHWLSSPLTRCQETARRLGIGAAAEPRLTEMDWGEWEGYALAELRARLGDAMAANESKGLDFRPPGGESPRDVQDRLKPLLADIAASHRNTAAVTHKGVIRAVLALATGWEMLGKPPHRLSWPAAHLFSLDAGGHPAVERLNIAMERR